LHNAPLYVDNGENWCNFCVVRKERNNGATWICQK